MTFNISSDSKTENKYVLQKKKQDQNQVSFKGMESVAGTLTAAANYAFSQVQTGEMVGPAVVDIVSMVAPRTYVDSTRGRDAGIETGIRESSGFINNCILPGFVAAGVGWAIGKFYKPDIKINTGIPVNSDTLDMLHDSWKNVNGHGFWTEGADKKQILQNYYEHILNKTEGLVGKKWVSLSDSEKKAGIKSLADEMADLTIRAKKASGKELKSIKTTLVNLLGASENLRISTGNDKYIKTTSDRLIDSAHGICRDVLTKIMPEKLESSINKIKEVIPKKTALGLGIIVASGLSQQYINRYMTKKRTGSDVFVGLSDEAKKQAEADEKDSNKKLKLYIGKAVSIAALMGLAVTTFAWSLNPKVIREALKPENIKKSLEFNGWFPSLKQLRSVIYPAILVGRVLASSDKNELRETDTRDIPGFLNWLVLGGFVSKLTGKKISGGKLINTNPDKPLKEGANLLNRIGHFLTNESLVTHAEIDAMKGIDLATKKLLKTKLNLSIAAGLVYSTTMLGFFVPELNKYITNKITAKKKQPENLNTADKNSEKPPAKAENELSTLAPASQEVFADFIKTQQRFKRA